MQVRRLTSTSDPAFDELVRIYSDSFPESERKPVAVLAQMLGRPEYWFLVAEGESVVIGFSISIAFDGSDAALGEYMAVDARCRTMGAGPLLFRATVETEDRFMLIEIDAEAGDRERLKRFYRRFGCRQVEGLVYRMPQVASAEPPLMDLLVYARELPSKIEKKRLRAWLEACYTQVYGQAATDPRIVEMLAPLPDSIALV